MTALDVVFGPGRWSVNRCMRPVVAAMCTWEVLAILSGNVGGPRVPTVTGMVHHARRSPLRLLTWAAFGWLSYHLFFELDGPVVEVRVSVGPGC